MRIDGEEAALQVEGRRAMSEETIAIITAFAVERSVG
jgi:hypothetical protein